MSVSTSIALGHAVEAVRELASRLREAQKHPSSLALRPLDTGDLKMA
jgi:hypothetical protein